MGRRGVMLAAGLLAVATPLGAWAAVSSSSGQGCQVTYKVVHQWPGGFLGDVKVTNGGSATNGWTVRFRFPSSQKVVVSWNTTHSQSGAQVTMKNASWNANLAANGSTSMGFVGTYSGSNPVPASFTLNGVTCNAAPSPTPTPTTPTPTTPTPTTSPTPTRTTTPTPTPTVTPTTTSPAPTTTTSKPPQPPTPGSAPALKVSGNKLVTSAGANYRILGVNRSGGEFACIQGYGIWDGPMDAASIDAMRSWKVRTVRIPVNEECWLGTGNVKAEYGGANYQTAVKTYVNLVVSKGITPIVEMHWNYGQYTGNSSGCSDTKASCQKPMPDAQYAPQFWTSVANTFKGNDAVILDLFNEPYPERATGDATSGWTCWRDGGTCAGIGYRVAGFQSLVDTVRATGATNVIMIGGLAYSNDASRWLEFKPKDPLNNIMAFAHVYNFNSCNNSGCWDSTFGKVAAQVPFAFTEIGENDCAHAFIDGLMDWADAKGIGYLGWTWNTWNCSSGPSLISDYNGTATPFGQGLKARLASASD